MGMDFGGLLFYGLVCPDSIEEDVYDLEDEPELAAWKQADNFFEQDYKYADKHGITWGYYGASFVRPFLAVKEGCYKVSWDETKEMTGPMLTNISEWDEILRAACKELVIPWKQPAWILACHYSN